MGQGCPPDVAIINCLGREVTAAPFVYVGMLCPGRDARDIIDYAGGNRESTVS